MRITFTTEDLIKIVQVYLEQTYSLKKVPKVENVFISEDDYTIHVDIENNSVSG